MKLREQIGVGLAACIVTTGCAAEQPNTTPDNQPLVSCFGAERVGGIAVRMYLGESTVTANELFPDAIAVIDIEDQAKQSVAIKGNDYVTFDDLSKQSSIMSLSVRNLGPDDPSQIKCDIAFRSPGDARSDQRQPETNRSLPETGF